MKHNF